MISYRSIDGRFTVFSAILAHIIALKLAWCVFVEVSERTPGESHALLNVLLESLEYLEADAFALF